MLCTCTYVYINTYTYIIVKYDFVKYDILSYNADVFCELYEICAICECNNTSCIRGICHLIINLSSTKKL